MRFLIVVLVGIFISAFSHADTLSDSVLIGTWQAQFSGSSVSKDPMLVKIEWIRITFLKDNRVEWTWKREGKIEDHKGKYSLSIVSSKSGAQTNTNISLIPETIAVHQDIRLQKASLDHDSRFPLPDKVLKCKDHEGYELVFSRLPPQTK